MILKGPFDNLLYQMKFYLLALGVMLLLINSVAYVYHKHLNRVLYHNLQVLSGNIHAQQNINSMLILEKSTLESDKSIDLIAKNILNLHTATKDETEVVEVKRD